MTVADAAGQLVRRYALSAGEVYILSPVAEEQFSSDLRKHDALILRFSVDAPLCMSYLLSRCSESSFQALEMLPGSVFDAARMDVNPLELWKLISATHFSSAPRAKIRHMMDLVNIKMTSLSHEAFAADIRSKMRLVLHSYGSKEHPGFVNLSDMVKGLYLAYLDPYS